MDINKYKKINECKKLLEEEDKKNKAIIALQSVIKRKNIEPLIQKQFQLKMEDDNFSKSKSNIINISANINNINKKNIYPLAPIYKVKELRNHIKNIYQQYPETKKEIKLNASKSDMIKFLTKYKYPLNNVVTGFKPPKKPIGRPPKLIYHNI